MFAFRKTFYILNNWSFYWEWNSERVTWCAGPKLIGSQVWSSLCCVWCASHVHSL